MGSFFFHIWSVCIMVVFYSEKTKKKKQKTLLEINIIFICTRLPKFGSLFLNISLESMKIITIFWMHIILKIKLVQSWI